MDFASVIVFLVLEEMATRHDMTPQSSMHKVFRCYKSYNVSTNNIMLVLHFFTSSC
jgi:hypothetical protein